MPNKEENWAKLKQLEDEHLFDKAPLGETSKLVIYSRNDALDWQSYSELWSIAIAQLCNIATWIERASDDLDE